AASSPAAVAEREETVLLSLPDSAAVQAVAFGKDSIVAGGKARTVIDLSTIGPQGAASLSAGLADRGVVAVDAPVSGGVPGARKGTLAVMVACRADRRELVEPILENFGKVFFVGETPGQAQMMKLVNNLLSVTALAISSEALVLGAKAGLDPDLMVEVINAGSGCNTATLTKIPNFVLPRSFDYGFALALSVKDTNLCLEEGAARGVPMRVGQAVRELLATATKACGPTADMTDIIKPIERQAGIEVVGRKAKGS
ncbi:MAG: NAD(P)-dependent oxidoreductase, partial [Kiloniellales bacterium]